MNQREIKFRYHWLGGNADEAYPHYDVAGIVFFGDGEGAMVNIDGGEWPIGSGKGILCQFTGLKDKNGREIYEGDVVRKMTDGEPDRVFEQIVMKWEPEQWTEEGFMTGFSQLWTSANQYEIIGNVFENPELIKK